MRQPRYADPEQSFVVQFLVIADGVVEQFSVLEQFLVVDQLVIFIVHVVVELFVDIKLLVINFFVIDQLVFIVFVILDGIVIDQLFLIDRIVIELVVFDRLLLVLVGGLIVLEQLSVVEQFLVRLELSSRRRGASAGTPGVARLRMCWVLGAGCQVLKSGKYLFV